MNDHANRRRERLNLQIISVKTVKVNSSVLLKILNYWGRVGEVPLVQLVMGKKVALVTIPLF